MRRSAPRGRTIGLCIENPLRRQYPGTGERGSSGPVRALLLSLLEKGHILLTSSEILVELARVLRYPRLQALFGLTEEQIYNYVQFLREVSQPVIPDYTLRVSIRDPQDIVVFQTVP
jgi:putative PIN family toxin of toxin-antitoxin system